jgi:hypothetical protein
MLIDEQETIGKQTTNAKNNADALVAFALNVVRAMLVLGVGAYFAVFSVNVAFEGIGDRIDGDRYLLFWALFGRNEDIIIFAPYAFMAGFAAIVIEAARLLKPKRKLYLGEETRTNKELREETRENWRLAVGFVMRNAIVIMLLLTFILFTHYSHFYNFIFGEEAIKDPARMVFFGAPYLSACWMLFLCALCLLWEKPR